MEREEILKMIRSLSKRKGVDKETVEMILQGTIKELDSISGEVPMKGPPREFFLAIESYDKFLLILKRRVGLDERFDLKKILGILNEEGSGPDLSIMAIKQIVGPMITFGYLSIDKEGLLSIVTSPSERIANCRMSVKDLSITKTACEANIRAVHQIVQHKHNRDLKNLSIN